MINAKVKEFLDIKGFGDRLTEHAETIDTVEHAAQQIGCTEPEIAKTLSFIVEDRPVIVVMAGDGKVNSSKFKSVFHTKPHMIPRAQVEDITGFQPGGVCPFAVPAEIPIWLAAANEGVDSCWLNFFDPEALAEDLGLPENEEILMLLDLGYAAEGAGPLDNHNSRKELSETVSYI
ncbi:YbaK/EbsC family protein [Butyrivibrio sp. WCD3002]|uniref:YbaK/EbsC family protein n=1 Tax=Butyrivibrio sp. WCD3002 TaxID=1280676 RepID=UPI000429C74D|nr:YbaK/EbsC family protein [Butyrivibrio sp. WCD3002]